MMQHGQLGARQHKVWLRMKRDWQLYLFVLLPVAYYIVFHYMPIYGIQIAFKNYKLAVGIEGSPWVGLENFGKFFSSYSSWRLITNTLLLNLYGLLVDFPIPIFIALMLNRISSERYKKFTQTVIYIPHFISTVVMAGMLYIMLDTSGVINTMITKLGGTPIAFMAEAKWFRTIYIASGEWQSAGWNTILYIAALTSVDPQIYEASTIDGATIWQKIRYIDIPSVVPLAMMMLILPSVVQNVTDEALDSLRAILREMDGAQERADAEALATLNRAFHGTIEHLSDKMRILRVIDSTSRASPP